jgi:hypothetical protein
MVRVSGYEVEKVTKRDGRDCKCPGRNHIHYIKEPSTTVEKHRTRDRGSWGEMRRINIRENQVCRKLRRKDGQTISEKLGEEAGGNKKWWQEVLGGGRKHAGIHRPVLQG